MTARIIRLLFLSVVLAGALMLLNSNPTIADSPDNSITGDVVYIPTDTYADYLEDQEMFNSYVEQFHQIDCIDYKELRSMLKTTLIVKEIAHNLTVDQKNELDEAYTLHGFVHENIMYEPVGEVLDTEQILEEKRGDCSEKALLLASLLSARGIEAYVVDGYAHRYVFAKINNSWIPLDPTQDFYFAYRNWKIGGFSKYYSEEKNFQPFMFNRTATIFNKDWCSLR